jgi:hypothetical protein
MSGKLEATRALVGLFPGTYLIADQTGLGQVEICYDNVQWVDRRAEPVRADDPHVANYYGRLSFDLIGRYREQGELTEVFGFNFISPDEYHYLFAAATDEVLGDSCPTEWVGSRIVTGLGDAGPLRIVPDRLTYLAAARSLPSQVFAANWSRNQEWRDGFVTGLGVTAAWLRDRIRESPGGSTSTCRRCTSRGSRCCTTHCCCPLRATGATRRPRCTSGCRNSLRARRCCAATRYLFYPQAMLDSGDVRGGLEGRGSLLDMAVLRRYRDANVAVSSINERGVARLDRLQATWSRQPEAVRRTGSSSVSVAHAITRLNALYEEFFADAAL